MACAVRRLLGISCTGVSFMDDDSGLTTKSPEPNRDSRCEHEAWDVIVVGAGIAGLAAAHRLSSCGLRVLVLEGQDRVGGRIWSERTDHCSVPLEFGAQWIHGQANNPLHQLCKELDLLSPDESDVGDEWSGEYRMSDGSLISPSTVQYVLSHFDNIKRTLALTACGCTPGGLVQDVDTESAEDLLRDTFSAIASHPDHDPIAIRSIFDWFLLFERIDNACPDLRHLSVRSYTDWQEDGPLVNFRHGYSSVTDALVTHLPPQTTVMLSQKVTRIAVTASGVSVWCKDKMHAGKHVIVTVSLGVLKAGTIDFQPPLPSDTQSGIQSVGFGTINKIFIRFASRFWRDSDYSLKLVWGEERDKLDLPDWVYDVSGFDTVRGRDDVLMAWIGGHGAQRIERESESRIGDVCRKVISMFTQRQDIPEAMQVICTKWFSNQFFAGSYSHPTTTTSSPGTHLRQLFLPVMSRTPLARLKPMPVPVPVQSPCKQQAPGNGAQDDARPAADPRILFAGEHTAQQFGSQSSAHGALSSGNHSLRSWTCCQLTCPSSCW